MIKIWVKKPNKLSGRQSAFLKFDYSQEIVDVVKTFYPAIFNKNDLSWEVGINYLGALLDKLCFYDDIDLKIEPTEISEISFSLTEEEINSFRVKPFAHQIEAINFGLTKKDKWLCLDSMGLGKSLEAMYLAETLYKRGLIEHCFIICGVDSLRANWKAEIKKFSNLSCIVLGETITKSGKINYKAIKDRAKQLEEKIEEFFIITNVASIRSDEIIKSFNKSKNKIDMIVVDEIHRCSSKNSAQGNNLLKLNSKYKLALTGTPIVNSPLSTYLPLSWTENDKSTLTNYKAQYCEFGGAGSFNKYQITGYKNLDLLKDELDSCSLRRTFSQVKGDMPKKTVEYEIVEMSEEHQKFYEAVKAGVKEEVDKVELKTGNLLALTTRLRQATAAPSILTTDNIESSKILRCVEIAEDILSSGEKVIIFSNFIEPCNILYNKLKQFNPLLGTGQQNDLEVSENIDKFRNSKNFNLLICTMSKLGTGFSMPECHYAILLDQPWTAALQGQVEERIYRITSDQPVYIKVLVCANTIDERVQYIVSNKKDLSDYIVDGVENKVSESLQNDMRNILLNL